jgi:DNA-binding MarR family transcriptional regulator
MDGMTEEPESPLGPPTPAVPPESTVTWQVDKAAAEHGEGFDPELLTLTLTLYRSLSSFDRAGAAELAEHGLTVGQFNILTVLHRAERPLSMGELALMISVRPANMTAMVDALVRRGLIARQVNPEDRRSYLVVTTEEGEQFLADFLPGHWRFLESLAKGVGRDDRRALIVLLERLRESVDGASA